jgi:hypothetical protein
MSTMTLEQVRDWLRNEARVVMEEDGLFHESQHREAMAACIDIHLTSQQAAEPFEQADNCGCSGEIHYSCKPGREPVEQPRGEQSAEANPLSPKDVLAAYRAKGWTLVPVTLTTDMILATAKFFEAKDEEGLQIAYAHTLIARPPDPHMPWDVQPRGIFSPREVTQPKPEQAVGNGVANVPVAGWWWRLFEDGNAESYDEGFIFSHEYPEGAHPDLPARKGTHYEYRELIGREKAIQAAGGAK